jgi:hypothetical protein
MLSQKLFISPIEYRISLAREHIGRERLCYVKDYTQWIIRKHSRTGKFIWPTKEEMECYNYYMEDFIRSFVDIK